MIALCRDLLTCTAGHRSQATGHDLLPAALDKRCEVNKAVQTSNGHADRLLAATAVIKPAFLVLTYPSTVASSKQDGSSKAFVHPSVPARLG